MKVARAAKSVFFATLAALVDSLCRAERGSRLHERVKFLSRHGMLIIDEIRYLTLGLNGGNLFF